MSSPSDRLQTRGDLPLLLSHPTLSLSLASIALSACISYATSINVPVNISVYSASLHPLLFARMDRAKLTSIAVADAKAFTAAGHRAATDSYGDKVAPGGALWGINHSNQGRFSTIKGGLPVFWKGSCVGGIGVSGGTPDQDRVSASDLCCPCSPTSVPRS